MMKKKFASLIALALCMIMILGACGNQEAATTETQPQTTAPVAAETQAPETEAEEAAVPWEDTAELVLYYFTFVPPKDTEHIEAAINAIIEPAINTVVDITVLDVNSYIGQIGMMMGSGERIDLMLSGFASASFSSMMAQKQLMDISGYLDEYGADIKAVLGDMLKATTVDGGIYGVPCYRNLVSSNYIFMRKDVLDDLGLTEKAENMSTLEEYVEILETVKNSEKWGYLNSTALVNSNGPVQVGFNTYGAFSETDVYSTLGDTLGYVHCDENGVVSLTQETDAFQGGAAVLRDMYSKGLIYNDIGGMVANCEEFMKSDALFCWNATAEFGAEAAKEALTGMDLVAVEMCKGEISSDACTKFAYLVPVTAEEPEAAVAFLNYAFTSNEINTLMAWGEEGVDFEVVDGVAQYIEGNEEPLYHLYDYSVPNQFLVYPWSGDTADFRERSEADLKQAKVSQYLGFSVDLSEYSNQTAAVSNVIDEYRKQIESGEASEETLQAYIDKLYASGVQDLLDAYQTQLDAWLGK